MTLSSCFKSFGHRNVVQKLIIVVLTNLLQQPTSASFRHFQDHHHTTHELATSGYFHEEPTHNWDDLELQLLSKVKGPSLQSNGFHVINATFPAKKTSYIMHLSKTQGLYHPEQLGISTTDASYLECVYSGTVSQVTNGNYSESGIVSVSACHHEFGFEGLMLLPSEQYFIKPSTVNQNPHYQNNLSKFVKRSTNATTNPKPLLPHKAYKVNSPNDPNKDHQSVHVVLRVPPDELLKASQNLSKYLDTLEDEDPVEPDSSSHSSSDEGNENDESNILETPLIEDLNDCEDGDSSCNSLPPVMVALSKGQGKQQKRKQSQKRPQKMAASTNKAQVVEIAVFTDAKLYQIWQSRYPRDTMTKMNQMVLAVINNMNALYKQPSMTENLAFRLVHMEIETSKPRSLNEHNGHATKYLKAFCDYSAEKNQYGRLWDHALLLTGWDLQEDGTNATAGIAWFSTMCINGLSCSVIEGSSFGSTFITAHEIGHSLGMDHDGTGPNTYCDANSYIMSPTTGGGKTDWSKCSMKNMRDYINKGYKTFPSPTCITKKGSKAGSAIKFSSTKLPGQQFNANEQCNADCKGCTPYVSKVAPYNDMCHALYCQEKRGFFTIFQSSHPALEGTTCAKGKTCRFGKCK